MAFFKRNNILFLVFGLMTVPLRASETPTAAANKEGAQALSNLLKGSPSDQSPTVAGVRGLEDPGATPDTTLRDFAAIERLDLVKVHDDELSRFNGRRQSPMIPKRRCLTERLYRGFKLLSVLPLSAFKLE